MAFLPGTNKATTNPNGQPSHPKVSTAYAQALEWQGLLIKDGRREDIKPLERSSVARVWCELEECKRKLKMKPLPGSLRPTSAKPQRKSKPQVSYSPAPESACGDPAPTGSVPAPSVPEQTPQEPKPLNDKGQA